MDGEALSAGMKPSDVVLAGTFPLIDTFGRAEREIAAALIVRTCQMQGDEWQPVGIALILATFIADVEAGRSPWTSLARNPFTPKPDFNGLAAHGWARWDGDGRECIALTDAGREAIARRWRKDVPRG